MRGDGSGGRRTAREGGKKGRINRRREPEKKRKWRVSDSFVFVSQKMQRSGNNQEFSGSGRTHTYTHNTHYNKPTCPQTAAASSIKNKTTTPACRDRKPLSAFISFSCRLVSSKCLQVPIRRVPSRFEGSPN